MPKPARGGFLPHLRFNAADLPLHAQLYRRLRDAILDGSLGTGARLPSTRTVAVDLGVSRTTAEEAYAQLDAEGYVVRRVGDGSYVARIEWPRGSSVPGRRAPGPPISRALSGRGHRMSRLLACDDPEVPRAFRGGLPALEAFPLELWQRLLARRLRRSGRALLGYGDPAGYRPLREALAGYLATARGVRCSPDQVLVLTSSQQALDLAARLLLDPGDAAWLEDPAYPGARTALQGAGACLVPVPVDEHGMEVETAARRAPAARLAYVTPSHQYPTGATLSLERRLALLAWAERAGAWVLEDDYDSEYRYDGRPLAAIHGLDTRGRVLYAGTLSKVMFPSLRLAYLVVPDDLVEAFRTARTLLDGHTATIPQAVMADFIAEGHFAAHVRRMRAIYRERRDVLLETVERRLGARVRLGPADGGLHVTAYLEGGTDDRAVSHRAARAGVDALPLSRFCLERSRTPGLVLGYAGLPPAVIREGVRLLARALTTGVSRGGRIRIRRAAP